jgi:hypothetical protein
MISKEEEQYILKIAYVPEHIVSLMTILSKAEPLLIDDHLIYVKDNWAILVGYPLGGDFSENRLKSVGRFIMEQYTIRYLWVIAPEMPGDLAGIPSETEHDDYYRLDIAGFRMKGNLQRAVTRAKMKLIVELSEEITKEHESLIREFLRREKPGALIRELFSGMPEYVNTSGTALVLNALDPKGRLSAFFVIETAAKTFDTYVVGCHSKKHYVPYASDLLFFEMIDLARENGKGFVNLGLGVNSGIRRFKEKWGGVPFLKYEFCEYTFGQKRAFSIFDAITSKL